ncbi:MAG: ArsC family reductase [Rhodothalassiaceae bacterium]
MIVLFGLKNCDSCRKARKWLEAEGLAHRFVDVRTDGLAPETLDRWIEAISIEALLNRRGTTWRGLSDSDRADLDEEKARALMLAHPALIRRPVIDQDGHITVGFDLAIQARLREAGSSR